MSQGRIQRPAEGDHLSAAFLRRIVDAVLQKITVAGGQAHRIGSNLTISIPEPTPRVMLFFRIDVGATATGLKDGANNSVQWTYNVTQVVQTSGGYDGWEVLRFGYTGLGYNMAEIFQETGENRMNNGIEHADDYPAGFAMVEAQGLVVPGFLKSFTTTKAEQVNGEQQTKTTTLTEAWFFPIINAEDGGCS